MTSEDRVRAVLREHGLRSTGQRLAILRLLADAASTDGAHHDHRHLTATDLHDQLAAEGTQLDLTTVYRTVTTLVELGVVHATAHGHTTTYGLAATAHHHAVCTRCGTVSGIESANLAGAFEAVERSTGFRAAGATITVHGVCRNCRGEPLR